VCRVVSRKPALVPTNRVAVAMQVCEFLKQTLAESSSTNELSFTDESRLRDDLGLDSLRLAVLAVKIEAEFGVDVFKDSIPVTVGDIEERIREHQQGQESGDSISPSEGRRSDLSSGETDG